MSGFISTLNLIPLIYVSILMLVPHCLDYCSFVVCLEIGKWDSANFVLFQDSGSLVFSCEFGDQLVNFCQK